METIWENISTTLELSPELSEKWLGKLRVQYSEPHRHYHNEQELLRRKIPKLVGANVCLQLAALFQYYCFEVDRDCMTRNCEAVSDFFHDIGTTARNKTLEANVKRLLGDLQVNFADVSDSDIHFFQDLDLLVLGTPSEEYKQYTQQLHMECTSKAIRSYDKTRLKARIWGKANSKCITFDNSLQLLQTLNRIPCIYLTKEFSEHYESIARKNIEQEIAELQAK